MLVFAHQLNQITLSQCARLERTKRATAQETPPVILFHRVRAARKIRAAAFLAVYSVVVQLSFVGAKRTPVGWKSAKHCGVKLNAELLLLQPRRRGDHN